MNFSIAIEKRNREKWVGGRKRGRKSMDKQEKEMVRDREKRQESVEGERKKEEIKKRD